ncbi:MAG TPA: SRPBCC domain-containing protein [Acidimicrobiales bacterium]|nr:SRPBCC domain-containing protein [Acidimicrobiales bacterium]
MTTTATTTQVYRVYVKAQADKIWQALTDPEWTNRYGYTGYAHYDLKPGGKYEVEANAEFKAAAEAQGFPCPDIVVDGEVLEADPPHKLVTTWRLLMDPGIQAEGFSRITYEIKPLPDGSACSLTVTHDDLEGMPLTAAMVAGAGEESGAGGGHAWILSDLKSLLETGSPLAGTGTAAN